MKEESTTLTPGQPVVTWGEGVRWLRIIQGMDQDQLAERAGVVWSLVADLETGFVTTMNLAARQALAGALGVDHEQLFPMPMTPCPSWCTEHEDAVEEDEEGVLTHGGYRIGVHRSREVEVSLGEEDSMTLSLRQWEPVAGLPHCPKRWVDLSGTTDLIPTSKIPALVAALQAVEVLAGEEAGR